MARIKDVDNEDNYQDMPIRLPEGRHGFRERLIGKGTVPPNRWLDMRAQACWAPVTGATVTS
jgi:hypothetical protein